VTPAAIHEGLFDVDGTGTTTLIGGYSATSGLAHFPRQPVCPFSGADDVVELRLARGGRLWLWTAVTAPPPGYDGPVPYGFGIVELDGEPALRVVGRLTVADPSAWTEGARVEVTAVEVPGPGDDGPRLTWAFAPSGVVS
jgi:uncharacterized OB-fold protein